MQLTVHEQDRLSKAVYGAAISMCREGSIPTVHWVTVMSSPEFFRAVEKNIFKDDDLDIDQSRRVLKRFCKDWLASFPETDDWHGIPILEDE